MLNDITDRGGEYGLEARKTVIEVPVVYSTGTRTTLARLRLQDGSSGSNVSSDVVLVNAKSLAPTQVAIKLVELDDEDTSDRSVTPLFSTSLVPRGQSGGSFFTTRPFLEVLVDDGSTATNAGGPVRLELISKLRWDIVPIAKADPFLALPLTASGIYPALPTD